MYSERDKLIRLCTVLLHLGQYSVPLPVRRLSWPKWLVTYRGGLPACGWSLIPVLTGPDEE